MACQRPDPEARLPLLRGLDFPDLAPSKLCEVRDAAKHPEADLHASLHRPSISLETSLELTLLTEVSSSSAALATVAWETGLSEPTKLSRDDVLSSVHLGNAIFFSN